MERLRGPLYTRWWCTVGTGTAAHVCTPRQLSEPPRPASLAQAPQRFEARVPKGVAEGGSMRVMAPYGVRLLVPLPPGSGPGHTVSFTATMPHP